MDAKFGKTKDTANRATQKSTTRWKEVQQGFSIIESHQKAELLYLKHSFLIEQPTCTQLKLHAF